MKYVNTESLRERVTLWQQQVDSDGVGSFCLSTVEGHTLWGYVSLVLQKEEALYRVYLRAYKGFQHPYQVVWRTQTYQVLGPSLYSPSSRAKTFLMKGVIVN